MSRDPSPEAKTKKKPRTFYAVAWPPGSPYNCIYFGPNRPAAVHWYQHTTGAELVTLREVPTSKPKERK